MSAPLIRLHDAGVCVRLDSIGRDRLLSGSLRRLVEAHQVRGVCTNPAVVARAVESSDRYDREIAELALTGVRVEDAMRSLTACDARWACDILRPVYEATDGVDGHVSLEADPRPAHDAARIVSEARALRQLVDRPNLLVQIPATAAGMSAATECLAEGIGVELTLVFSLDRCARAREACLAGLERAVHHGRAPARIASLISFQVAPVDTAVDARLDALRTSRARRLRGRAGLANARLAYQGHERALASPRWQALQRAGARAPRLGWAATAVEDGAYEDTRYVEGPVAAGTVTTLSEALLYQVADHGLIAEDSVRGRRPAAREVLAEPDPVCVEFGAVTDALERHAVNAAVARWAALTELVDAAMNGEVAQLGPGNPARTSAGAGESWA